MKRHNALPAYSRSETYRQAIPKSLVLKAKLKWLNQTNPAITANGNGFWPGGSFQINSKDGHTYIAPVFFFFFLEC